MKTMTLSRKNQVVIPSSVRLKLGLKSGDKIIVDRVTDTHLTLKKEPSYKDLIGTIPTKMDDPIKRIRKIRDSWE